MTVRRVIASLPPLSALNLIVTQHLPEEGHFIKGGTQESSTCVPHLQKTDNSKQQDIHWLKRLGLSLVLLPGIPYSSSPRAESLVGTVPTLICPKPMVMVAAEVKPLMTGQEMKSSRNPGGQEGILS